MRFHYSGFESRQPERRLPEPEVRKFFVGKSEVDAGVRRQDRRRRRLR